MLLSKLLPLLIFFQIGMAAHTFTPIFTLHIAFSSQFCYQNCYPAKKTFHQPQPSYQNCYPILCLPCVYMEIPRLTYAIYGVIGLILLSKLLPTAKRFRQHDINCCQKCYPNKIPPAKRGFIKTVTPKSHYSREFPCFFPRPKMRAFASKWKIPEHANIVGLRPPKSYHSKQIPRVSMFFLQSKKCEPSRANGNSQSKPTYVGLPPPKPHHSKPIPRVSMFFCSAKNASLREQMETLRASRRMSDCDHKKPIISNKFREFPCFFALQKMRAFASKWKLSEQADVCRLATIGTSVKKL